MISDAVGSERVSRVVGYKLTTGNFQNVTPNLPQRIAIIGEANNANQATITNKPREITSAQQAGEIYGFGSPIHMMMRILRPISGDGVGGIPTVVYPQMEDDGAVAREDVVTVTGTATANAVHTIVIGGRRSIDGQSYNFSVLKGDTPTAIAGKIRDAVNGVLGCPFTAVNVAGVVTLTAKCFSASVNVIQLSMDNNNNDAGITYAIDYLNTPGEGTTVAAVSESLALFSENWNTIVVNGYNDNADVINVLQDFNGIPDPTNPTGRYTGIIMKPFIAFTGSNEADLSAAINNAESYRNDVTIALCSVPNTPAAPFEGAANYAAVWSRIAQDNPNLDIAGKFLPDMPVPVNNDIVDFASYNNRDLAAKNGISTVTLEQGRYRVQDFVTTYHPAGDLTPQFRYVRNLNLDFNVRFGYYLLEQINVVDHSLANDSDTVTANNVLKPKQWKGILFSYADDLARRNLIVEPSFMKNSILVGISATNPDRIETFFRYKRSGFVRIASTTAEAGFNFGTL
jgi:phage tail sheath gpL-like